MKNKKIFLAVFFLALVVRMAFFTLSYIHNDYNLKFATYSSDGYEEISQNLLQGHGFSSDLNPPYEPNSRRLPLWVLTIDLFVLIFGSYWPVLILLMILGSAIPILGMHIADKLSKNRTIYLATGILLALEPFGIFLSTVLCTETLFTFLFLLSFIFLIRYFENKNLKDLVLMTLFLSLATLTKPTSQYLPILVLALLIYESWGRLNKQLFCRALVVSFISIAMLSPWLYRNYVEFGKLGLSSQVGIATYFSLTSTVLAIDKHTNFATEYTSFIKDHNVSEADINLSNADYYVGEAFKIVSEHKIALVESAATSVVTFFTHDGMLTFLETMGISPQNYLSKPALSLLFSNPRELLNQIISNVNSPTILVLFGRLWAIFLALCFLIGTTVYLKAKKISIPALAALLIVLYFALTTTINGFGVNARYRAPVNVFIFTFALYGLIYLKPFIKRTIKNLVIYVIYYSGLILRRGKKLDRRLFCIGYHSIYDKKNERKFFKELYPNISISTKEFEKQLTFLKKNGHTFVHFSDLKKEETKDLRKPTIIFFDDGFKDVAVNALPILKKLNIPATVFITTGLIDRTCFMWTLGLRHFFLKNGLAESDLNQKIKELKKLPMSKMQEELRALYAKDNFVLRPPDFEIFLDWPEVEMLYKNGIEIGSHCVSHCKLIELSTDLLENELNDSKRVIESKIGGKVEAISYPYGRFDVDVEKASKLAGYSFGVSTQSGFNDFPKISSPYALKKISPEPGEELPIFAARVYMPNLFT